MPLSLIKSFTQPIPATIDQLSWLTGGWKGKHDDFWAEELWSHPHEGTILGSYRRHSEQKVVLMDIINITQHDQTIKYFFRRIEDPLKPTDHYIAPAMFTLCHIAENECTFVHDDETHPYWIHYKRENNILSGLTCDNLENLDFITKFHYEKYL